MRSRATGGQRAVEGWPPPHAQRASRSPPAKQGVARLLTLKTVEWARKADAVEARHRRSTVMTAMIASV